MTDPIPSDDEFADFILNAAAEVGKEQANEALRLVVCTDLNEALERHQVDSLVDGFGKTIAENFAAALDKFASDANESPGAAKLDAAEFHDVVDGLVRAKAHQEADLMALVVQMRCLVAQQPEQPLDPQISVAKKEVITSMLVDYELTTDDPWIKFLNEMIPGEGLTEEDTEAYRLAALEKQAANQYRKEAEAVAIDAMLVAAGREANPMNIELCRYLINYFRAVKRDATSREQIESDLNGLSLGDWGLPVDATKDMWSIAEGMGLLDD